MTPNHASYLDPFAIAAVLNWKQLRETYWAGWTGIVTANAFMRFLSRLGKILPVEPTRAARTGLALGAIVLKSGKNLVWFPEGERSPDGRTETVQAGHRHVARTLSDTSHTGLHSRNASSVAARQARSSVGFDSGSHRQSTYRWMNCCAKATGEKPHARIANALQEKVAELGRL